MSSKIIHLKDVKKSKQRELKRKDIVPKEDYEDILSNDLIEKFNKNLDEITKNKKEK
jgi:hypothetical protein